MTSEMYVPTNSVEMTYDEMEYIDGGIGIAAIKAIGISGAALSITCSIVLALDSIGWIKLGFWAKIGLKIARFVCDIVSTIAFTSLASREIVGNFIAKILQKKFGVVRANDLAYIFKTTSALSHYASIFDF